MTQKKKPDAPFTPRPPDYDVSAMKKGTEFKGRVGAAWRNEKGQIQIYLNPFVVLEASPDLMLTLFPVGPLDKRPAGSPGGPAPDNDEPPPRDVRSDPADGDPIPF